MNKSSTLFVLLLFACQAITHRVIAQTEEKTFKEQMADLKKSFHPDKAFILPFNDSANEDLQAFLFEVKGTKGVNGAQLSMKNQKAIITVNTKQSMVSVWNNLPKEMRTRYTVSERTSNGFTLTDSYQNTAETSPAINTSTKSDQKQNTTTVYEQAEKDAAKDYQSPDTTKAHKSILQQQQDYAEQMRQKNKDIENEVLSKNNNLFYKNPDKYDTAAPKEKGKWYVEYTFNGKKVTMYLADTKVLSHSAGKNVGEIHCSFLTPKPFKSFDLSFTNPALYPDIRKFEFCKPDVYSKWFKAFYITPNVPTSEHALVKFYFSLNFSEGNPGYDTYHIYTSTGQNEKKGRNNNVESGYFEVLYFESRENGILEARFAFTAKDVPCGWGGKKKDIVVTDGKLRIRVDNQQ